MNADPELRRRLDPVLDLLAADPASLSSIRDRKRAWKVHVEDSLSGLELVGAPARLADVGAGAGFPGLVLAAALPATRVDLIESVGRKAEFIERAIAAAGLANARALAIRSEEWARDPDPEGGREAYEVVTARAVGRLSTLAELASPLPRPGRAPGRLEGPARSGRGGGARARRRAPGDGAWGGSTRSGSVPARRHRHLYLVRKTGPTPAGLPRRPGMAKKRPFG